MVEKSKKILNGLAYNLAQSYFSTLNYFAKGYMCDWIVNGAYEVGVSNVKIDLLRGKVEPPVMNFHALTFPIRYLIPIIHKELEGNRIATDYIKEAIFEIEINDNREIICNSYTVGDDGRVFKAKKYHEKSYEKFDPFDLEPELRQGRKHPSVLKKIKYKLKERKEKRFWQNPDHRFVAIKLNYDGEQVYGKVRDGLGLLNRIPKPETGYSFQDVVIVGDPVGTQPFRDDEIDVFVAKGVHKKSTVLTFTFSAIIPNAQNYFDLGEWFKKYGHVTEFPWTGKEPNLTWRKGRCTADNLDHAKMILSGFANDYDQCQVKDVNHWDHYKKHKQV